MLKKVVVNDLVYGGKCVDLKVRLNKAFLFFNAALMRKYFSEDGVGHVVLSYDDEEKLLVVTPCAEKEEDSLKIGKVDRDGRIRYGFLPIKRVAATHGFVGYLDNASVPVKESGEDYFSVSLIHKKAK